MPNRLRQVLDSLRKEQSLLELQLGKVRDAIAALGGTSREQTQKAKPLARKAPRDDSGSEGGSVEADERVLGSEEEGLRRPG